MSKTFDEIGETIAETADFRNLKRQLDDLPGNALKFVRENFSGLEGAQMVTDITGMFEPTPFSDIAGGVIAIARGDWLSLGTSLLGIIPYIGDTGKIGKWAARAVTSPKYARMVKFISDYTDIRRRMAVLTQSKALASTRREMWDYYQRHLAGDTCELCKLAARKMNLPRHGTWSGPRGNSTWMPDASTNLSQGMKDRIAREGGVPFVEGMPDYSKFATELPPAGSGLKTMPIEMNGSGRDINRAFSQYFDMMESNGSAMSRAQRRGLKDTHTWHHTDQGMQLVPKSLHNITEGGPSHVGARSWLSWPNY